MYFFAHYGTCLVVSFVIMLLPSTLDIAYVMSFSLFVSCISTFILGISSQLSEYNSKVVVIVGLVLSGISTITPNYATYQAIIFGIPMVA